MKILTHKFERRLGFGELSFFFLAGLITLQSHLLSQELSWASKYQSAEVSTTDETFEVDYFFTNKSEKALTILEAIPDCDCVTATLPTRGEIPPGGNGALHVSVRLNGSESHTTKHIFVRESGATIEMTLEITALSPILVVPSTLMWSLNEEPKARFIKVTCRRSEALDISVSLENRNFAFKRSDSDLNTFWVTPLSTETPMHDTLFVEGKSESGKAVKQQVTLLIR